jgi:hypothetical protein
MRARNKDRFEASKRSLFVVKFFGPQAVRHYAGSQEV